MCESECELGGKICQNIWLFLFIYFHTWISLTNIAVIAFSKTLQNLSVYEIKVSWPQFRKHVNCLKPDHQAPSTKRKYWHFLNALDVFDQIIIWRFQHFLNEHWTMLPSIKEQCKKSPSAVSLDEVFKYWNIDVQYHFKLT